MENETQNNPPKQIGSFVGLLIIIVLMVIGGLYFWGQRLSQNNYPETNKPATSTSNTIGATTTIKIQN